LGFTKDLSFGGSSVLADGALREVARTRKVPLADARITARVTSHITDDKRHGLGVPAKGHRTVSDRIR
jgi:hypothetical protein